MQLKGFVKLIKKDAVTGEETFNTGWMQNTIYVGHLSAMSQGQNDAELGPNIVISEWEGPADQGIGVLIRSHDIGTDVVSPQRLGSGLIGDPYYVEFQQSFPAPVADIDINTIGLTGESSFPVLTGGQTNTGVTVDAFTKLGTTCTQLTTETLIVFYRVQFLQDTGSRFEQIRALGFANTYGLGTYTDEHPDRTQFSFVPEFYEWPAAATYTRTVEGRTQDLQMGEGANTVDIDGYTEQLLYNTENFSTDSTTLKRKWSMSDDVGSQIGRVRGSVMIGPTGLNSPGDSAGNRYGRFRWFQKLLPSTEGYVQNIYSHSSAADKPFFDPLTTPTTDGTVAIQSSGWTRPDWHNMFRIEITSTGAVGAGEYKFYRRRLAAGFDGNTYAARIDRHPSFTDHNNALNGGHNFMCANNDAGYPWIVVDDSFVIAADPTGVLALNPVTGEGRLTDSTTDGTWAATELTKVMYDEISDTIWCSCRNTGIYSINAPRSASPTVTFHDITSASGTIVGPLANQAYSITTGIDTTLGYRKIWAFVEGALVESTDNGATWTAYDSTSVGTTFTQANVEANWSRIVNMKSDPNDTVNEQMAFVYDTGSNTGFGHQQIYLDWWTPAGDTTGVAYGANETMFATTTGPETFGIPLLWSNMLDVSPDDQDWWWSCCSSQLTGAFDNGVPLLLAVGTGSAGWTFFDLPAASTTPTSTTTTSVASCRNVYFVKDDLGNDAVFCVASSTGYFGVCKTDGSFDQLDSPMTTLDNTLDGELDVMGGTQLKAYFPNSGIMFAPRTSVSSFIENHMRVWQIGNVTEPLGYTNYEHLIWEEYGWNGANWVKDNPNSKTIHASQDALIDGLTISFDDNGGTQNFVATDYFTTGVVDGIWMDGNTEFDWSTAMYFKPSFGTTDVTDLTPSTAPAAPAITPRPVAVSRNAGNWVDVAANTTITSGTDVRATSTSGVKGARYNIVSEGDFECQWSFAVATTADKGFGQGDGVVIGVSSAAVIGSGLSQSTVQYGFYFNNQGASDDDPMDVDIIESGVVVANIEVGDFDPRAAVNGQRCRYTIRRVGTDINYYLNEKLVHTTGAVPGGSMIQEVVWGNNSRGRLIQQLWAITWTDYWVDIGNGTTTGIADTNYYAVDTDPDSGWSFTIGGSEGTNVGNNTDTNTGLVAGEYSVYPSNYGSGIMTKGGVVRLASADASAALTANYTYVRNG